SRNPIHGRAFGGNLQATGEQKCPNCDRVYLEGLLYCPFDGATLTQAAQGSVEAAATGVGYPIGKLVAGQYTILGQPIVGHAAHIYKVRHRQSNKVAALKVLQPELVGDGQAVARFQSEAYLISTINHPHVVTIHDFGTTEEGYPFMALKFIEGPTLAQVLKTQKSLDVQRAVIIFSQVCAGLAQVHQQMKIHANLAPHHILLTPTEVGAELVTLIDFSRAQSLGVPQSDPPPLDYFGDASKGVRYASPEQLKAEVMDDRSDIYSLGCLLYEVLVGIPPFDGTNGVEIRNKHISKSPTPPSRAVPGRNVPPSLEQTILKAIEKTPDKRYQTVEKFARDLREAM
ncbi:MAG TPA: serine/threonine-protein kinase, partial [Candidatus Obscuribacterales bacterium]